MMTKAFLAISFFCLVCATWATPSTEHQCEGSIWDEEVTASVRVVLEKPSSEKTAAHVEVRGLAFEDEVRKLRFKMTGVDDGFEDGTLVKREYEFYGSGGSFDIGFIYFNHERHYEYAVLRISDEYVTFEMSCREV